MFRVWDRTVAAEAQDDEGLGLSTFRARNGEAADDETVRLASHEMRQVREDAARKFGNRPASDFKPTERIATVFVEGRVALGKRGTPEPVAEIVYRYIGDGRVAALARLAPQLPQPPAFGAALTPEQREELRRKREETRRIMRSRDRNKSWNWPRVFEPVGGLSYRARNGVSVDEAERLEREGYFPEEIFRRTGWYRDEDQGDEWRYDAGRAAEDGGASAAAADESGVAAEESSFRARNATEVEAAELDKGPTIRVYRAMQLRDGKLYPPMAGKVDGKWQNPAEIGRWLVADERPDLADEQGRFKLDKGNGSSIKAAYNPYWHTSRSPLNDQFSSAWRRPELVTVEVEVPASELTSGYRAEKAKDAVGEMSWHSGPVSSRLAKVGRERRVILSRYCKVVRVVPDAEVAKKYANVLKGTGVSVPANTVTPSLRAELIANGVEVTPTKEVPDIYASKQSSWSVSDETRSAFAADERTSDWTIYAEPDEIADLPVLHMEPVEPVTEATDNNSVERALRYLFEDFGKVTNEETEESVVFNRADAGKILMFGGVDMRKFGRLLKPLFERASLAWTEPQREMDKHKSHVNVVQYRQFIAKFDGYNDPEHGVEGDAFIRFTVRIETDGRRGVHAARVSEISVINSKGGDQSVPARKLGGQGPRTLRDRTLARFLSKGNNEFAAPSDTDVSAPSTFRARGGGLPTYELNAQNGLQGERMDSRAIIGFRQADILARMRGLVPAGSRRLAGLAT